MTLGARVRGQALVPVMFIVLIMTALAVAMTASSRQLVRQSTGFLYETRQYWVARGAVEYAAAMLEEATASGTRPPELGTLPGTDANGWTQEGDAWFKLEIIDTASRLNVNTASARDLAMLPGLRDDPATALAIVDWRDADDTEGALESALGAEDSYYQSLSPPYAPRNAPIGSIDELLLVRGMTPARLHGVPVADNAAASGVTGAAASARSRQSGGAGGGGAATEGDDAPSIDVGSSGIALAELLTTFSQELNTASDGTRRLNVNSATQEQLTEQVGLPSGLARQIVQQRQQNPFVSMADLLDVPGVTRAIMQRCADRITVSDAATRDGVVNINTAPLEVLAALPGVDQTIYEAIITARQSGTVFGGLGDLFQLTSLNRRQLRTLVDHVSTKSSAYLVRVRVRVAGSPRVYAAEALVVIGGAVAEDTTAGAGMQPETGQEVASRIVQWRTVPRIPGWSSWSAPPVYQSVVTAQQ